MAEPRYLTPRQRIAAGVVTVCCGLAVPIVGHFEGRVRSVYPDIVLGWNAPSMCDGHVDHAISRKAVFTDAECDEMTRTDLRATFDGLAAKDCLGDVPLPDHELAAYLSLGYNGGPGMVCHSSIVAKLKAGDHAAACATISQFRFVGGKDCGLAVNKCAGIVRRRTAERNLCEGTT